MMASSHSGFSLFTTTPFKDLVCGQSSSHWQRLRVSSYRGVFLFNHEPYHPQRDNKVGVSSQTTPMGTITYTHSPRTRVDSSRHTHGSESSPIVQGLVQDINVYKTYGPWLSRWNLSTTDAFKMQWVFSFLPRQTNKYPWVLHTRVLFFPTIPLRVYSFPTKKTGSISQKKHTPRQKMTPAHLKRYCGWQKEDTLMKQTPKDRTFIHTAGALE